MASFSCHFAFHQKVPHETCLIKFQHSSIHVFTFECYSFRGFPSCSGSRQFAWYIIFIDCILLHMHSSGVQLDRSTDDTTLHHFTQWCLLVPLIGYKPLSGPWGTIVNRGELLWNPTDFFVVGCWDHISYGGPRLSYQLMYRSICQSLFYRYSTDTRPTSNQCYYRYSLDIATDIYIYIDLEMRVGRLSE